MERGHGAALDVGAASRMNAGCARQRCDAIPFGRMRGRPVRSLPSRIVLGLLRDDPRLGTELRAALIAEAQRRRILAPLPRVTVAQALAEIARHVEANE